MEKLILFFQLFRQGSEVADPAKWKSRQITATMLVGVFVILQKIAKSFGYEIPLNEGDMATVGGAIVVIVNVVLTMVTSKRAGFPIPADQPPFQPVEPDRVIGTESRGPVTVATGNNEDIASFTVTTKKRDQTGVDRPAAKADAPLQPVARTPRPDDTYFG
jgi:uncharacterized membrane protein